MTATHPAEITLPFGTNETKFCLKLREYAAWESERDKSLMATFRDMISGQFAMVEDIRGIISFGAQGAGMSPAEANKFLKAYVDDRPPNENLLVAIKIADAAIYGSSEWRSANPSKMAEG